MPIRRSLLILLGIAASLAATASQTASTLFQSDLRGLWENRGSAAGIVYLYRAESLLDTQDGTAAFEGALLKILSGQDADVEVKSHAASRLADLYRSTGRLSEAQKLEEGLGFINEWRVVGPFDDENKQGFDAAYGPEQKMEWEGRYEGKGQSVTWRSMPVPAEAGVVPLDQLLVPSEKVLGYAISFVWVPRDTPAVLRGGYNEAYKVWVDGELVASRKDYNGRAFDQRADACTLNRGWNAILVKVCNQDAGWNFVLRLTDAAGNALTGWRCTSDPSKVEERREKILAKNGAPPAGFKPYDPEVRLRESAERAKTPLDEALLGQYMVFEKTFDRSEDPQVQILRKAAEAAGKDGDLWMVLGDSESDLNRRRAAYQKALDLDPADPLALERMGRYYNRRGMPFPALDYIRRARAADPASPHLQALQDTLLLPFASDGLAMADLKKLYAAHPHCSAVQESYLAALKAGGGGPEAVKVLDAYRLCNQTDVDAWFAVIADKITTGRTEEAIQLLTKMGQRFPYQRNVFFRKASLLYSLERDAEAEATLRPVLAWAPDWPEGQELLGDILGAMGRQEQSMAAYQQALILKPQMESVKRKVAFLKPQEEGFEARYRIDSKDLPGDLAPYAGQQAVVLVDNTAVKVEPNGLSSRYVQKVIQVMQPGAAQQMQSWPIAFDPDRQEVRILDASILKPDGSRVHAETMVTDALSDPQYRLYYRNRNLVLSFPSLAAGDRLWIEYKISEVGEQNDYGKYFGDWVPFAGMAPILLKQYTLIMPEDFPLFIGAKGMQAEPIVVTLKARKVYRWVVRDIQRIRQEPGMPGFSEVAPYLHLSTFQDWDALGAWYSKFIADQWEATPDIKAKVAELLRDAKSPEDKVRAIHRWVVQQTHYVGLEFGVHGYRPYKVKQIFERRFGDCKDKAILMAAMLKVAGFDASLVLIRTKENGALEATPASLAIFNHCICYVPELNLFLDGTAEYSGMRELPYQDQGVWVQLVWQDGRTKRLQTPTDRADQNRYEGTYEVRVPVSSQEAETKGSVTLSGQECAWIRRRYQDVDKQRERLEKDLSGSFPGTRLSAVSTGPMADLSSPVTIQFEGVLGQIFRPDGKDRVTGPIWMGHLNMSNQYSALPKRALPLVIDYPWRQSYTVTYVLPPGASAGLPSDIKIEGPFGSAYRTVHREGSRIALETEVSLTATRVETTDYEAFRAFCQQVDKMTDERIRIVLTGGQP